jgi:uncharacterized protein
MSRIRKGYEARFRALFQALGVRRLDEAVKRFTTRAQALSEAKHISFSKALTQVYEELALKPGLRNTAPGREPTHFICDSGLGGLARWLRGAGYEAEWLPRIADDDLLVWAREISATILTTDSMLMERRLLRDGLLPALWLPPTLSIAEQLTLVFREYHLPIRTPRCMQCGGELCRVEKDDVRERIPPRTYRWLDDYFACSRCGKLFWHGTHWERIRQGLAVAQQESRR